jgi:hypothetical protein
MIADPRPDAVTLSGAGVMTGRTWFGLAPTLVTGAIMAASSLVLAQAPMAPATELEPIEFALAEDEHYRILMPRRSRLSPVNKPGCVMIWHPLATRSMTFLELCSASDAKPSSFASRTTLTNGARVSYAVDHNIGGGSGGTEGELKGQLDLNGKLFGLICRDQGEWGNNPSWCLHYLGYLDVKERK